MCQVDGQNVTIRTIVLYYILIQRFTNLYANQNGAR